MKLFYQNTIKFAFFINFVLAGCESSKNNEMVSVVLKYDNSPWQDVSVTASRIPHSHATIYENNISNSFIKKVDGDYIGYSEFSKLLSNDRIASIVKFESSNGISTSRLGKGCWVIVLLSDTTNKDNATVLNISGNEGDVIIDFRTKK